MSSWRRSWDDSFNLMPAVSLYTLPRTRFNGIWFLTMKLPSRKLAIIKLILSFQNYEQKMLKKGCNHRQGFINCVKWFFLLSFPYDVIFPTFCLSSKGFSIFTLLKTSLLKNSLQAISGIYYFFDLLLIIAINQSKKFYKGEDVKLPISSLCQLFPDVCI